MKTTRVIGIMMALIVISAGGHRVLAQQIEKQVTGKNPKEVEAAAEKAEQDRALDLQERKLMLEQQKMEQEMQWKQVQMHNEQRIIEMGDRERDQEQRVRELGKRDRIFVTGESENPYIFISSTRDQAQLTLRNTFRGGSDSSQGEFDVDKDTRHIRCMINGRVQSGTIQVIIHYPNGEKFKDLMISSSAEISFQQTMTIKEGEESKYVGTWKYKVVAEKAEGNYLLQISSN
jgi:hypothetical protein